MNKNLYKIVTIGGGSGQFALLRGLRDNEQLDITAVVSMVDSGGSTGRLRDRLGVLPPGDPLKCILALSPHQDIVRTLFLKRFQHDRRLRGHNAGNMLLTMLSRFTGSFTAGVQALAEILDVRGRILPVTVDKATLVAELTDGSRIYGERAIDTPRGHQREKIKDVWLVPHHHDRISVYPPVIQAIEQADFIIIGPGDLFTSILPNLIVPGVSEALARCRAKMLYVLNIMTKFGETHQFRGRDFVTRLQESMGRSVDAVLYNNCRPPEKILEHYRRQKAEFVQINGKDPWWRKHRVYACDLLDTAGGIVRHNPRKLAALVERVIRAEGDSEDGSVISQSPKGADADDPP